MFEQALGVSASLRQDSWFVNGTGQSTGDWSASRNLVIALNSIGGGSNRASLVTETIQTETST
jgi:hypothetical protein